jgi:3-phenylpropionate/trans-cinnamate dioxygenase ferredoxin reductase subunit
MAAHPHRIVIVGAGLAGATAAATMREQGYEDDLLLLGAELHRPYELPPLSKRVLLAEGDEPDWVHEENFYVKHGIDLRRGVEATRIELGSRTVSDSHGGEHPFDRLLLATGSRPRTLNLPGADLEGIRTLRAIDDSLELRAAIEAARRVVIVGGGWIGCEAAAAARTLGAEVTVVEGRPLPLAEVLGDEVAGVFKSLHDEHGVQWKLGGSVAAFTGEGTVDGVQLADGTKIPGDVVLVAVGAAPRTELARAAGLDAADDGGISVDAGLRTAAPDVYAAGDIASHFHPRYGRRVRSEHWANAKGQGEQAGKNLVGEHEPYLAAPYFFTDQYDLGCEYRGLTDVDTAELVVRGDLAARDFTAFWLERGRVAAAMNVNQWDDVDALQALVEARNTVTADELRTADLAELAQR